MAATKSANPGWDARMATQQQFVNFLSEIEPSDSTKAVCASANNTLRDKLAGHETYKAILLNTYLSGSYARNTALRPRTTNGTVRRPDVDIIVVTNHTQADLPSDVIWKLRSALRQLGYEDIESNRRSVCVKLGAVEMDVVPIIEDPWNPGRWLIADKSEERWIFTNPSGHTEWAVAINKKANGNFKPLVKLLKWWRRENLPYLRRPKGFIIETLVAELMDYKESSFEELFIKILERIKSDYEWTVLMGIVPTLEDPSVLGNNVFSRVKPEEFKRFYDQAVSHAALARRAQKEQDPDKALELWKKVFGDRFKMPTAKSNSLLQAVASTGAGLTFPNRAVGLPNKPPGFA
jgi:hypothetical protein